MSFMDEIIGRERVVMVDKQDSKPTVSKTADNQNTQVTRVSKSKIREACMQDSISFNMLNLYTNTIMKAGYKFTGDSEQYLKFFKKMMSFGDKSSLRRLFKEMIRDRAQYGAAFLEIIPYSDGKGIGDLRRVNASRIDYVRDKQRNIILNSNKTPYGFVMDFGKNAKGLPTGDQVPGALGNLGFSLKSGQIYLKESRIAVFPLYRLDNSYDYLGLIEPAYQDIVDRLEVTKIQVDAIKVKATSLPVIYVGDSTHEATPQSMDDADFIIQNLKEASGISMPNHMKIDTLEYKSLDTIEKTISMLISSSAAASGTPVSLITGMGGEVNRGTLKDQVQSMIGMLQSQIQDFVEDFNVLIMQILKNENGFNEDTYLLWNGIRYEDKEAELKDAHEAFNSGGLCVTDYQKILVEKYDWSIDPDFVKKFGNYVKLTEFTNHAKESDTMAITIAEKMQNKDLKQKSDIEKFKLKTDSKKTDNNEESKEENKLSEVKTKDIKSKAKDVKKVKNPTK